MKGDVRWVLGLLVALTAAMGADEPRLVIDSGGHQALPRFLAFTRDGKSLVPAGDDKVVRIWDIASGKTVRTILGQIGDGGEGKIYTVALSPDERYLAVGGELGADPDSGVIRIHDFHTGDLIALLKGHARVVYALAFSADGRWLASGSSDNTLKIWDSAGWKLIQTLSGHKDFVYSVAFSPDGRTLVSGSRDKMLRLWDRASGRLLNEMKGHQQEIDSAAFSPDGRYIASGGHDRTVKLWDGRSGAFLHDLAKQGSVVFALAFSPDGRVLLTAGGEGDDVCHVFAVSTGREVTRFSGHDNTVVRGAFSVDGKMAATGGGNQNEIFVWNPVNAAILHKLAGNGALVRAVGYGRDGNSVAFGTSVKFTNTNDRSPLEKTILLDQAQDHGISVSSSVQNPDGFIRARDRAGDFALSLKGNDLTTLQILRGTQVKHEIVRDNPTGSRHNAYSLSPNGTLAASGGDYGTLTIYSTSTGNPSASCVGHTAEVWAVAFSPDGKTLVSGSFDQTVRIWDVTPSTCRNLLSFFVGTDNEWVGWTPQGYYTASANGDKYIGWHVNQGPDKAALFYPAAQFRKQFYRPDVIAAFLRTRDIESAVKMADAARGTGGVSTKVLGPADVLNYPPPWIVVASPFTERAVVRERILALRAVARADLPITAFEVLVNGTCQVGCSASASGGTQPELRLEAEVVLQPGENRINFLASHAKATSPAKEIVVTWQPRPGEGKRDRPKLIVLAIGVSLYENPRFKLGWAAKDALDVENAFLSQKGNPPYSDVLHHRIVNGEVTAKRILDELKWLNDQGGDDDIRVVFLSGHGGLDKFGNYYFYAVNHDPADPAFNDLRWQTLLERLTSRNRKAVLIVDTCHAGAVVDGPVADPQARGDVNFDEVLSEMKSKFRGLFTLAASMGTESSWEKKEWQHGAFTKALLEALSDGAAAGKVLSTDEITNHVKEGVKALKVDQHPTSTYTPSLTSFPFFPVREQGGQR